MHMVKQTGQNFDYSELVQFLDDKFSSVHARINELGEMFRDLQGAVDAYAKRADSYFQEMVLLTHQVQRHDKWIRQIAEKVGVHLED